MPLPSNPSTLDTYGGVKQDYEPAVSGDTDRTDKEVNQLMSDVSQIGRMIPKARLSFSVDGSIMLHQALWGSTLALKPSFTHYADGYFNFTLPATVQDPLGVTHTVSVNSGFTNVSGTSWHPSNVTINTANTFTVRTWNAAGNTLTNPGTAVVHVFLF